MKTADILTHYANYTVTKELKQRIQHLATLATKQQRITTTELLNINLILISK